MRLIKISALWCTGCLITNKNLKDVIDDYDIEVVNFDYDFDDVAKYNVGKILPVLILEKSNKEVARLIGEKTKEEIRNFLEENK